MNICVYAASSGEVDAKYLSAAAAFGRLLAERGHGLVFGGGATGLMGELARAVSAAGGEVTGVAPEFFNTEGVLFQRCTRLILTGTIRERKQLMEDMSDGFAALPGGIGTFEEFFEILTLRQLGRHEKPVALYNVSGYYDGLNALVETAARESFLKREAAEMYRSFGEAEMVLDYLERGK